MSGEHAAAWQIAADWARHGTIDAMTTNPDGIPLPSFVAGEAIAVAEIGLIRDGGAPPEVLMSVAFTLFATKDKALITGFFRRLQAALLEAQP